jgi:hypothetical protein
MEKPTELPIVNLGIIFLKHYPGKIEGFFQM